MALILAMGTYGAGYVARIVGAFIFGKMGDRIGRKKVDGWALRLNLWISSYIRSAQR